MEFGDDLICKCPDCNTLFVRRTLMSYTSHGSAAWTDGYRSEVFFYLEPLIARCPGCRDWFVLEKAETLFHLPPTADYGEMIVLDTGDNNTADDYISALAGNRCAGIEKELRLRLLWRLNADRRRSPKTDPPDMSAELHDNLERLLDLLGPEESILRAEILRELGDFEEAQEVLGDADGEWAESVRRQCAEGNILPARLGMEEPPEGMYPFPCNEDVFAFPAAEKEDLKPLLSVDLSLIDDSWEGRGTFFYGKTSWLHRYDRLFSEEEWQQFQTFPDGWKKKLREFWQLRTGDVLRNPSVRNDYYRVLYQLYYGILDCVSDKEIDEQRAWLDPLWTAMVSEVEQQNAETARWLEAEEERCYWDYFWMIYTGDYPDFQASDLIEAHERYREYEKYYHRRRSDALEGFEYINIGGDPSWFQGSDMTPKTSGGKPMEFVGQFWTDYLGITGSMLVYLFYDAAENRFEQVYDYD